MAELVKTVDAVGSPTTTQAVKQQAIQVCDKEAFLHRRVGAQQLRQSPLLLALSQQYLDTLAFHPCDCLASGWREVPHGMY
jgi:hypothetical protein